MKRVVRILLALAAVLVIGAAAIVFRLQRSVPPLAGTETLPGLGGPVEVAFDSLGIPHISAASDLDAFRALGYLHARERLWQMETLRRAAEGRLSEIIGPSTVPTDRYLRSLDIPRVADRVYAMLPPESRAVIDAYVAGVNQWIAHPTRPLPPEFVALRFRPEPWTARNSFEVSRVMSWDLASASGELGLARAAAVVGPEAVRELFPWYPDTGVTIIRRGEGRWTGGRKPGRPRHTALGAVPRVRLASGQVPRVPALAEALLDAVSMRRASNSWVIGGSRTASGKPILANDPHLFLRAPSIWYLATIEGPHFTVSGATIAGLPPVVIGHNRRIAWGLTNMEADDADYVIERLTPDSARVETPGGWAAVDVERDTIRVKGGKPVAFTLRRTPNGPVTAAPVSGASADSGGTVRVLALRWNALTPSDELTALLALDRAGTWPEFLAAVSGFKSPEQNWIYADVDGTIGYTASGNIPVRHSGEGLLPTPGWTGEGRWDRYLAFDELPRVVNPAEGFIVTANDRIVGPEYPYLLANNPAPPYRAERIRELITARAGGITPADVRRMQMDTVDVFARWAKALAADAAEAEGRRDVAAALRAWDGTQGADRTEPVVFWLWYRDLQRLAYHGITEVYMPSGPFQHWLLEGRTPAGQAIAPLSRAAMREALAESGSLSWGAIHQTVSGHALGTVAALNRAFRLDIGPSPRAGSLYTVDVADFGMEPPFTNTHGPSFRQVVDLADMDAAGMIITTGESGNPLAPHYRDQAGRWWSGTLQTVPLARSKVVVSSVLRLVP